MYQSPVAAIAELIANAWDADSKTVDVKLPDGLDGSAIIEVRDDGAGMTFQQCQDFYLKVGRNRRVDQGGNKSAGGRPLLGRKGIGKFAGFGICELPEVDTISRETGEHATFQLDLAALRGEEYINTEKKEIRIIFQQDADQERKNKHGTKVTLRKLTLQRAPSQSKFSESMARRFLIHQTADKFAVKINNQSLPEGNALSGAEFDFPKDYTQDQRPEGLVIEDGFGIESIGRDQIKWRIRFTKKPIDIEELRGVSVFCGIKVAQTPFFFNLYGGLDGQHGQQYISGQVAANCLDFLKVDTITAERQRINWELSECQPLEKWGQERIKTQLAIWKKRGLKKRQNLSRAKLKNLIQD